MIKLFVMFCLRQFGYSLSLAMLAMMVMIAAIDFTEVDPVVAYITLNIVLAVATPILGYVAFNRTLRGKLAQV